MVEAISSEEVRRQNCPRFLTYFVLVDNVWLIATTKRIVRQMAAELTEELRKRHLYWKPESLKTLTIGEEEETANQAQKGIDEESEDEAQSGKGKDYSVVGFALQGEEEILEVPEVGFLDAVGVRIDPVNQTAAAIRERSRISEQKWNSNRYVLLDNKRELKERLETFASKVVPSFLHGCETWTMEKSTAQLVQGWETEKLVQIKWCEPMEDEDGVIYQMRRRIEAKEAYKEHIPQSAVDRWLMRVLSLTQAVALTSTGQVQGQFAKMIILWKSKTWWERWKETERAMKVHPRNQMTHGKEVTSWKRHWETAWVEKWGDGWLLEQKRWIWVDMTRKKKQGIVEEIIRSWDSHPDGGSPHDSHGKIMLPVRAERAPRDVAEGSFYAETKGNDITMYLDSKSVVQWCNGISPCQPAWAWKEIARMMLLELMWWIRGSNVSETWMHHMYRELNDDADTLAKRGRDTGRRIVTIYPEYKKCSGRQVTLVAKSDGSCTGSRTGVGMVIYHNDRGYLKELLDVSDASKARTAIEAEVDAAYIATAILTVLTNPSDKTGTTIRQRITRVIEERTMAKSPVFCTWQVSSMVVVVDS